MYDESQPEPLTEFDTPNATKFSITDVSQEGDRLDGITSFENHYRRLAQFNVGTYSYKWADNTILRAQDRVATMDVIMSSVELNRYQKKVARAEMKRALLQKWSSPNGIDTILVAICICATILRNDRRSSRGYHPNRTDETNDELFVDLLGDLPYQDSTIRSCIQKVQNHIEWESVDWKQIDSMT